MCGNWQNALSVAVHPWCWTSLGMPGESWVRLTVVTGASPCTPTAGLFSTTVSRLNVTGMSTEATRTFCVFPHLTCPGKCSNNLSPPAFLAGKVFCNILSGQLLLIKIRLSICYPFYKRYILSLCISCSQLSSQLYHHCLLLIKDVPSLPLHARHNILLSIVICVHLNIFS